MRECGIDDCGLKVASRGMCSKHYNRWLKYGDPLAEVRTYEPRPERCQAKEDPPCRGKVAARGLCAKHYTRFRKYGDTSVVMSQGVATVDPIERFESKYEVDGESGCWMWTAAANGHGWAMFSIDGKATMAHRFAFETFRGPIPDGYSVSRECGRGSCVNPGHLLLIPRDPVERFWFNVDKQDAHWLWKPDGFTHRVQGKGYNPRRYAWALEHGETDDYLWALCGEERCVRPEHIGKSKDRFWAKVDRSNDGCWYWMGSTLSSGYPHLTYNGESVYAHRLTYEWAGGELKEDHVLSHTCGHLSCVNPKHLEQITYEQMVAKREARRVPTECPECGKVYKNLKAHAKAHLPIQLVECPECGREYKNLKVHYKVHR